MKQIKLIRSNRGFTLVELVLAIIVLSTISAALSSFMGSSVKAYLVTTENSRAVDELRYSVDRISEEIRKLDYSAGQYQIVTDIGALAADTQFEFINTDGSTITLNYDAVNERLTIADSSVGVAAYTLADQVTSFDFNYYTSNGTASAADGTDLSFVEFQISLVEGSVTYSSRTRVAMRDQS